MWDASLCLGTVELWKTRLERWLEALDQGVSFRGNSLLRKTHHLRSTRKQNTLMTMCTRRKQSKEHNRPTWRTMRTSIEWARVVHKGTYNGSWKLHRLTTRRAWTNIDGDTKACGISKNYWNLDNGCALYSTQSYNTEDGPWTLFSVIPRITARKKWRPS